MTATGGTMTYWEAALALHNQQSQLLAADERFEEFASTNTWRTHVPPASTVVRPWEMLTLES